MMTRETLLSNNLARTVHAYGQPESGMCPSTGLDADKFVSVRLRDCL